MPISITGSQKINIDNGFVESQGSFAFSEFKDEINSLLLKRGNMFKDEYTEQLNSKKIVSTGNIENVDIEVVEDGSTMTLNISYPYYAKFVDEGVKGAISSANAPNSPYKFKNTFTMSAEGRKSISNWLRSAKAKIRTKDVQKYGAKGIEKKFKKISEFDQRLRDTIYNIKAYGIKTRDFIDPALKNSLVGFEKELGEAIGKTITINIFK